ncbi:MAG: hypothetical protein OXB92_06445 [Acidimicrobiaceae bacterium]|nr:hypothetical protein [Acidimicrobiia bacterium]MCY4493477.1 hypothetical protein [Acidimicrobiaceae bacterium]
MISRIVSPEWRTLLRSARHVDLYMAMVVSCATAVSLSLSGAVPSWTLIAAVGITSSAGLLTNAWRQRTALTQRLEKSDYGELLRMGDSTEDRVRAPYTVTMFASLAALTCSAATAVLLSMTTNRAVIVIFVSATAGLVAWSCLATVSLIRLDSLHNRSVSRLRAMREQAEADQRHSPLAN